MTAQGEDSAAPGARRPRGGDHGGARGPDPRGSTGPTGPDRPAEAGSDRPAQAGSGKTRKTTGAGAALPLVIRGLPLAAVLAVAVAAVVLAVLGHWKRGSVAIAAASGLALVLRLILPGRYVGPLAVRSRRFDLVFLLVLSGLLTGAAIFLIAE